MYICSVHVVCCTETGVIAMVLFVKHVHVGVLYTEYRLQFQLINSHWKYCISASKLITLWTETQKLICCKNSRLHVMSLRK